MTPLETARLLVSEKNIAAIGWKEIFQLAKAYLDLVEPCGVAHEQEILKDVLKGL